MHIQRLETIKAQLEDSPASAQDLWDQVANTFQFFADAARQGGASLLLAATRCLTPSANKWTNSIGFDFVLF